MNTNDLLLLISALILSALCFFKSSYTLILSLIILVGIVVIFIKQNYKKLNLYKMILFLLSSLGFSLYIYGKTHFGAITGAATTQFSQNTSFIKNMFDNSTLIFSFIYGISQIIGGYLLSLSPITGAVIAYSLTGILYMAIGMTKSSPIFYVLYGLLGFLSVFLNINTNLCPSMNFDKEWFTSLSVYSVSFACYVTCNIFASITGKSNWMGHYTFFGMIFIGLAVTYGVVSYALNMCDNKLCTTQKDCEAICGNSNNNNVKVVEEVVVNNNKESLTTKEIVAMFLYSIVVVIPMYAIQGGFFNFVKGGSTLSNELNGLIYILIPILSFLCDKSMMFYSTIVGLVSILIILLTKNTVMLQFAVAGLTIWGVSHGVPPTIVGKKMKNAGSIFGLLNFGAMFIGCFGGQFLFKLILGNPSTPISLLYTFLFSLVGIAFGCLVL